MKNTIKFSKGFIPCAIISIALIGFGVAGFLTKGINFGIDYKPGLIEEVRVAPPVAQVSYNGDAKVALDFSSSKVDVVISGATVENETRTFYFGQYPTVKALSEQINQIPDVTMTVSNGDFDSTKLFLNSAVTNQLSTEPLYIYPAGVSEITTDDVRAAFNGVEGLAIKQLGEGADASYQIRISVSDDQNQANVLTSINDKLYAEFTKNNVAIIKTDFIGTSGSKANTIKSIIMFAATLLLIWIYAAFRFHWDFALASIVALLHDTCIMMSFIIWTQMEFSATVLAAVLTIIGYSINATVVILDRVRFNLKFKPDVTSFSEILNSALSDTFTRSVLTTVTTLIAVVSLFVFTTGAIKDFSLAMIVGLVCGMYSSIFISSGVIAFSRRNWKPEYGIHHSLKNVDNE